jgi:hypothetical protein
VELIADDWAAAAASDLLRQRHVVTVAPSPGGRVRASGRWQTPRLPTRNLAFDVFWRAGDREWPVGFITIPGRLDGASPLDRMDRYDADVENFNAGRVDVILRPSLGAAARTLTFDRILDAEIVIPGVAVRREGQADRPGSGSPRDG